MLAILPLLIALLYAAAAPASDLSSFAFVNDDGTLRIRGQTVRLFGIIIPPTDQGCQDNVRPIHCAPRAALALNFKVGTHFVHCDIRERLPNDDVLASCTVNDKDLAAWLIQQGWPPPRPTLHPNMSCWKKSPGIGVLRCGASR